MVAESSLVHLLLRLPPSARSVAGLLLLGAPALVAAQVPPQAWNFDPDYYPSPTNASQRPPIALHATNDPRLLPYQILGIAGGYVLFTLGIFICLFTFGRRWRLSAQSSAGAVSTEMVKPNRWMASPGRDSPTKSVSSFKKWGRGPSVTTSPVALEAATFDDNVVKDHKARQEAEMARLFDTVMQQDTKSPKTISLKDDGSVTSPRSTHARTLSNSSRSFSQRRPPQLQPAEMSPLSPMQQPYSFVDGGAVHHSTYPTRTSNPQSYPASPRSLASNDYASAHSRQPSDESSYSRNTITQQSTQPERARKAKSARSARNLTISAPLHTNRYPGSGDDNDDDDDARTPLSPRNYGIPMPPPTPPGGRPITPIQDEFDDDDHGADEPPYGYPDLARRAPVPHAAPQRIHTDPSSPPPLPPAPAHFPPAPNSTASTSTHTLPLRAYAPPNNTNATRTPLSPGPTKTTLLSPALPGGFVGLAGPATGALSATSLGPRTPLSPYMPFTPVTPVTPRLVGREERRRRAREAGRRAATAEEDGVRDERDVWGSGW